MESWVRGTEGWAGAMVGDVMGGADAGMAGVEAGWGGAAGSGGGGRGWGRWGWLRGLGPQWVQFIVVLSVLLGKPLQLFEGEVVLMHVLLMAL